MQYIFLSIFVISTLIHLYARLKHIDILKNVTKIFILLPLTFYYIFSVESPSTYVIIALLMSWIGDLLLIPKGVKWLAMGGVFFIISHLFFILSYNREIVWGNVNVFIIVLFAILFASTVFILTTKLKKYLAKPLIPPMIVYLLCNATMNCFAIYRMFGCINVSTIITVIGALLFFVSDSALFFVRFNKESRMKSHFLVMLTYSLGEFLIVLGFILH